MKPKKPPPPALPDLTDPPSRVLPGFEVDPVAAADARHFFDELPPGLEQAEVPATATRPATGTVTLRWEVLAELDRFLRNVVGYGVTPREAGFLTEAHAEILRVVGGLK